MIWLTAVLVGIAAWIDLRTREIPDWIPSLLVVAALGAALLGIDGVAWQARLLGALVGFAAGAILFYLGGLGGGDVKLIAGIGAAIGLWALLPVLFWMALGGAVLGVVSGLRGQKEFAYGPAIAFGLAVSIVVAMTANPGSGPGTG